MVLLEGINFGELWGPLLGSGGFLAIVVTALVTSTKEKRAERKKIYEENAALKAENIKLIEQNTYHEKTIKRFIQIEMLKDPANAEQLKIWLDE